MSNNGVSIKHLFKMAGRKGDAFGSAEACLYFDGKNAIAANQFATLSIDCPQAISAPMLISVNDLKTALLAEPSLTITEEQSGRIRINGVRAPFVPAAGVVPDATVEMLNLDRQHWYPVVRPFRMDGGRLPQMTSVLPTNDVRPHLNGLYLDFATGAMVATDGHRICLIEEAVPVVDMPEGRNPGVIVPTSAVDLLSVVGGVQEVFVMERQVELEPGKITYRRAVCVGAAGAKFRVREIEASEFVAYRGLFDQHRDLPIKVVLDARGRDDMLAVASVAGANANFPVVTISGEGRSLTVSHMDRISRSLSMPQQVGQPFMVNLNAHYLTGAIRSAGFYNTAIRLRFSREEGKCVAIGSQDFHCLVMPRRDETDSATDSENAAVSEAEPAAT